MKLKVNYFAKWLLLVLATGLCGSAFAQRTISGTITDDATKEPLIGANILVVGTSTGTITDFDGKYELRLPDGATQLEISYTGYSSETVAIGTSNVMDFTLSAGQLLDEVVVVGYGTQKQREVTGSVTSVKAEDFNGGNINDPLQLVQGKVPGLSISKIGGDPNGGSTIRLRGLSTLGANAEPLIIIDGLIGASLESVDPNDIASIDVLKDGSAAAIYGSRGSSGVILITTKKGAKGSTSVEYNAYVSSESIANQVDVASPAEFKRLRPASDRGSSTDWLDLVTRDAISHAHNIALSGGFGGTAYRASFNIRNIEGVGLGDGFRQLNGRLNLTQKALNDKLTIGVNLSATNRKATYAFREAFRYAVTYNPTAPAFFPEGSTNPLVGKYGGYYQEENFDFFNPLAIAEQSTNNGDIKELVMGARADYQLFEGFTAGVSYAVQRESEQFGSFYDKDAYFRGFNTDGSASISSNDRLNELFEITGNYTTGFGGNNVLTLLGGYSWQNNDSYSSNATNGVFISNDLSFYGLGAGQDLDRGRAALGNGRDVYKVIAFFGRVNLNIDDTYFFMASARREGSTRFGEGNKWGIFPAVSAGVTLSNLVDIAGVDNLKLRVGYGETGAIPPGSLLGQRTYVERGSFFFNGGFVPAYGPDRNPNPDLKWETKGEFNAGLDFALADSKLTGTFEYYTRSTRDFIYEVNVPVPPNQASRTWANLEDVELKNTGIELSLGYLFGNKNGVSWEPRVLFSTYSTVLDTVSVSGESKFPFFQSGGQVFNDFTSPGAPGLNNLPTMVVQGGQEIGQMWGFTFDRVGEDGSFVYKDLNGDGVITSDDQSVIGNGLPDFSLGINNSFTFGDFDFNFFLRGEFGHDLINSFRTFYEPLGSRTIENLVVTEFFNENLTATPAFNSYYVEDASFIALDNATLGYKLKLPAGGSFKSLRLYLTAQNLFFITDYSGVDPSVRYADPGGTDNGGFAGREFNPDPLYPGHDRRNNYFRTRSLIFGLNLGF